MLFIYLEVVSGFASAPRWISTLELYPPWSPTPHPPATRYHLTLEGLVALGGGVQTGMCSAIAKANGVRYPGYLSVPLHREGVAHRSESLARKLLCVTVGYRRYRNDDVLPPKTGTLTQLAWVGH